MHRSQMSNRSKPESDVESTGVGLQIFRFGSALVDPEGVFRVRFHREIEALSDCELTLYNLRGL